MKRGIGWKAVLALAALMLSSCYWPRGSTSMNGDFSTTNIADNSMTIQVSNARNYLTVYGSINFDSGSSGTFSIEISGPGYDKTNTLTSGGSVNYRVDSPADGAWTITVTSSGVSGSYTVNAQYS